MASSTSDSVCASFLTSFDADTLAAASAFNADGSWISKGGDKLFEASCQKRLHEDSNSSCAASSLASLDIEALAAAFNEDGSCVSKELDERLNAEQKRLQTVVDASRSYESIMVDVRCSTDGKDCGLDSKSKEEISTRSYNPETPSTPKLEDLGSSLMVTDTDEDYSVIHWVDCSDLSSDTVKSCRGVIRRGDETVCKTFNYTPEFIGASDDALGALKAVWKLRKIVYPAFEGTNVRLWHDQGKWHLSTFRKLDAFNSRWGSKTSYGDLFMRGLFASVKHEDLLPQWNSLMEEIIAGREKDAHSKWFEIYCSALRKDRIYTFLVHSILENRIVTEAANNIPQISFTGEFDNDSEYSERFALLSENTSHISWPSFPEHLDLSTPEDVMKFVENCNPRTRQGLMVHYGVDGVRFGSIKLTSKKYQDLADLRGNEPSVVFRYLQLRSELMSMGLESATASVLANRQKFDSFQSLYPERQWEFDDCEKLIADAVRTIYDGYVRRYLKHEYVNLPQELWFIMRNLHDEYLQNPELNKISVKLVQNHINKLPAVRLNFIIRQAKLRNGTA